jgi:hypothetical protein
MFERSGEDRLRGQDRLTDAHLSENGGRNDGRGDDRDAQGRELLKHSSPLRVHCIRNALRRRIVLACANSHLFARGFARAAIALHRPAVAENRARRGVRDGAQK